MAWSERLRAGSGRGVLTLRGANEVREQERVRERPDAARDRGDGTRDLASAGEIDVTDELAVDEVDPDVDDDGAGLEHLAGHEAGLPGGDDHDVGPADLRGELARLRVA